MWGIPAAHVAYFFSFLRGSSTTREIGGRGGWLETMLTWRFMDLLRTVVSILTSVFVVLSIDTLFITLVTQSHESSIKGFAGSQEGLWFLAFLATRWSDGKALHDDRACACVFASFDLQVPQQDVVASFVLCRVTIVVLPFCGTRETVNPETLNPNTLKS